MNKTEFARSLKESQAGVDAKLTYKGAEDIVNLVFGHVEEVLPTLEKEDGVAELNITGYVKFTVKDVDAREARNPATGETVQVDATTQVRASVGAKLKASVKPQA